MLTRSIVARLTGRRRLVAMTLGLAAGSALAKKGIAADPIMIFAAATLKNALDKVVQAANASLHIEVTTVYGPTPTLVKQLENGAPGDIFFSADADWMDDAIARKIVDASTRVNLLSSRLVLIAPATFTESVEITSGFPVAALLGSGRLAMCDPMMMPAGRYGRAALQRLGVWDSVKDRVVDAADVLAALAYVSRREAALGIVFDTDAKLDNGVRIVGTFPVSSHPAILYPVAAVARSRNPDTARTLNFITSASARSIFEGYGYTFAG